MYWPFEKVERSHFPRRRYVRRSSIYFLPTVRVSQFIMSTFDTCTLQTCSLDLAYIQYLPSVAGNAFYLALFSILLLAQVILLVHYHAWAFSATMICGLILEVLGYVGRVKLHYNPFGFTDFLL